MLHSASAGAAPTAPSRTPAPQVNPHRETVLRLAAAMLPATLPGGVELACFRTASIHHLAAQFRELRRCWNFDVETAYAIDAWLALYGGDA